jgi:aryl-alcohol dehydrogenase-like predicted oxidoreductase
MRKVTLGRTGLEVTPICLGTWQFGGEWGSVEAADATAAIERALELGINFFDTARGYGWGASELVLGRALAAELAANRERIVIATKGGLRIDGGQLRRDSSPQWLRQGVEESLEALGVDYIDLYQIHWPDPDTPFEETGEALSRLIGEGKIRHLGVSNFDAEEIAELSRTVRVEALQPPYHLFRRDIEAEILPYCAQQDIGVLVYGPLAHGLLGGHMDSSSSFDPNDWRSGSPLFQGEAFERNLAVVRELEDFASDRGWTVAQLAIAWTLANPAVHSAIVGVRLPEHIEGAAPAAEIELGEEELAGIERIMEGAVAVAGPNPESA